MLTNSSLAQGISSLRFVFVPFRLKQRECNNCSTLSNFNSIAFVERVTALDGVPPFDTPGATVDAAELLTSTAASNRMRRDRRSRIASFPSSCATDASSFNRYFLLLSTLESRLVMLLTFENSASLQLSKRNTEHSNFSMVGETVTFGMDTNSLPLEAATSSSFVDGSNDSLASKGNNDSGAQILSITPSRSSKLDELIEILDFANKPMIVSKHPNPVPKGEPKFPKISTDSLFPFLVKNNNVPMMRRTTTGGTVFKFGLPLALRGKFLAIATALVERVFLKT
mmetsp:Transcript_15577/g.29380  ORF Transcript_15577/g.29380 Transcript_15577/m.29380 type:complete len:283 (+) Transcript_15577:1621-2469(+)